MLNRIVLNWNVTIGIYRFLCDLWYVDNLAPRRIFTYTHTRRQPPRFVQSRTRVW